METELKRTEALSALLELFREAGRDDNALLQYVDNLENKLALLEEENARLKSEIGRLKDAASRRSSMPASMNSRLKDALRE
ncbi:hypothetical protein [Paenibacillus soyae]|uniref:Uncharacterized protein n=1 Tax=Paenibacillus soyae TaxID=2969249 RepID=A0A9X2MQ33_9BACL|nr:hypothetical protein [Paenibacillus soyae]MCR2803793.1 hypothetical protein [Paenibacillus soyae]